MYIEEVFTVAEYPQELRYTQEHEWVKFEGDLARIGITSVAQSELGDIVFVELPSVGQILRLGDTFGTVESVKTVSDLFAPVAGEVVEVNESLNDAPEMVNSDPYGAGWMVMVKVTDRHEDQLLSATQYKEHVNE